MKVSLAHHWLFSMRGGEKVLEQFKLLFPQAPIACVVMGLEKLSPCLKESEYNASMLQKMGGVRSLYKQLLPLHPWLIRNISVDPSTQLCLSSDASMIKGIRLPEGCKHICYCHSPPRYLWDLQDQYTEGSGLAKAVFSLCGGYLRSFDKQSAEQVDRFVVNSRFVGERIERIYGRDCEVVYPPVELDDFELSERDDGYYLVVSQLTPYKKVELAVRACEQSKRKLMVIGMGEEYKKLQSLAGEFVTLRGHTSWPEVIEAFQGCRAFLYPQIEDFGITAVEAQACGKPVIAYGQGGATETVIDGKTGLHFSEQTVDGLIGALERFERGEHEITPTLCRENAERFSQSRFRREMAEIILKICPEAAAAMDWEEDDMPSADAQETPCVT